MNRIPQSIFNSAAETGDESGSSAFAVGLIGQVSLALLIVFVIATVIFGRQQRQNVEFWQDRAQKIEQTPAGQLYKNLEAVLAELSEQKKLAEQKKTEAENLRLQLEAQTGQLSKYKQEAKSLNEQVAELMNTPAGDNFKALESAKIDLQKQQLLVSLEKVTAWERSNLRLNIFIETGPDGRNIIRGQDAISGEVVDNQFRLGSQYANDRFADVKKIRQDWQDRVLALAGISDRGGSNFSITKNPDILTDSNKRYLLKEINDRIKALQDDTVNLQCEVLVQLQKYYIQHPDAIKDKTCRRLANEWVTTSDPNKKSVLLSRLEENIGNYVKKTLESQGVDLLRESLRSLKYYWNK